VSVVYIALQRALQLVCLRFRSTRRRTSRSSSSASAFVVTPATLRKLAPTAGRQVPDLYATAGATTDHGGRSSLDRAACPGESAVGLSAHLGEPKGLGVGVSATAVKKILRAKGLGPTVRRGPSWREFRRTQANSIIAVDVFTVDSVWLHAYMCCSSSSWGNRRAHMAGCTAHPTMRG
jgi:hypothetical protein